MCDKTVATIFSIKQINHHRLIAADKKINFILMTWPINDDKDLFVFHSNSHVRPS